MRLHLAAHAPHLVLKPPPRPLEGVVDGKHRIARPLIEVGSPLDAYLAAVWEGEINIDLIEFRRCGDGLPVL